ncbi:MAG: autotransporter-associated beta strand repeat-containing protein [Verrucomicrobiota bacterium]
MPRTRGARRIVASLSALFVLASLVHADVLIWDTNTVTADAQDGTGTWTTGSPNWFNFTQTLQNQNWADGSDAIFGAGSGTAGTLLLSGPITAGNLTFNAATTGTYTLGGTGTLTLANSTITNNVASTISAVIAGNTPWIKTGAGQLTLSGTSANTHTGLLSVNAGRVHLNKVGALAGNLEINSGSFVTLSGGTNQMASTASVTLNGAASVFNGIAPNDTVGTVTQTLASLTVTGGTFNAGANSVWNIGSMSFGPGESKVFVGNSGATVNAGSLSLVGMNGAASSTAVTNGFTLFGNGTTNITKLTVGAGGLYLESSNIYMGRGSRGAEMYLNGDVTTGGTTGSTIQISQTGAVLPFLGLSGTAGTATRTFNIAGGGANLSVNVAVTNGSATTASLVKNGAGTLTLSGAEANTYSGDTTINAGVLQLNKTAGVAAVSGNIVLNTGGTLTLSANNQIADTRGITVNGGTLSSFATDETIAFYTQNSGGLSAAGNTGHMTITGALTLAGGNTLTLNSSATPAFWNVGSAALTGADILLGGNNGVGIPRTALIIGSGGLTMAERTITLNVGNSGVILNLNGDFTGTGTNNINNAGGAGVQPLVEIGAATRTFNVINGTTTITAEVSGIGGSVVKTGSGLFQLTGANTYSGTTTVSGGTLSVAGAAGTLANTSAVTVNNGGILQIGSSTAANNNGLTNRINSAAPLTSGGGTVSLTSAAAGFSHLQSLSSLTINGGANTVNVTAAAGATSTLTFTGANPYVRTSGSVNFVQNPGVGGSIVLTNAPSGAGNVSGGVLVGATLNSTDLVAAQPGVLTAFSGWIPTGTDTWTAGGAMDVTGTNGTAYAATNITALRFNTAGPFTVTLDGTHTINSDVILMTPNAGAGTSIITGGTLRGTAGGDLVVSQNNTAGSLEIASTLANNTTATGLVKSGAGVLVLSGTNTYTGTTRVSEGTLRAADGVGLPTASALVLTNGVFESTSSTFNRSLGSAAGSVSIGGGTTGFSASGTPVTVNLGGSGATLQWGSTNFNPATLLLNGTTANAALELANGIDLNGVGRGIRVDANVATVSGIISNSVSGSPASLTKAGAGTLRLTQANTYDGGTIISAGSVAVGHNQALGGGTVTLGGGGLQADGAARVIANNVVITASSNVSGSQNLTVNGTFTNSGTSPTLTTSLTGGAILQLAGNVYLSESAATSRTLQFGGAGDRLISGVIANNAGTNTLASNIFFSGGGTLMLTGTNTYSGRTLAAGGGYLVINQDRSLGVVPSTPMVDNLILAGSGRLRASTSFTLDANRGIGIGNSGGGAATADIDVVTNQVFRVAGTVANRTMNHDGTASGSNVGSLNKTGAGVLELSGSNTYSGLTSVSNGILRVLSNTALGTSDGGVTVASTAHVELGNGVKVTGETITINTTMGTTGTGSAASSRGGLQAAAGARAEWAGDVIIGVNQARLGVQEGGFLNISGNITDGANSYGVRLSGETIGTGGLMLSGTANAWDGETELVRGKVFLGANNALPTNTILDIHFSNTNNTEYAGLDMNGFNQTVASLRNDGASGVFADLTNSSRTLSTMTVNETGSITYGGLISGNLALVKTGAGTLTLSLATNRFTGGATVNEGTLRITSATALAEGNVTVNGGASAGGKFDLNNVVNPVINALNGAAGTVNGIVANESTTNATRTLFIGVNHGSGSYAGNIVDNSGGTALGKIAIAKIGAGTQTLSGNGTYSGATLVSNGTLIADYAAGTPLGTSAITLQGGTMVIRNALTTSIGNLSLLQSGADFTNNTLRIEGAGTVTTPQFAANSFAPLLLDISSGSTLVATTLSGTTLTNSVLMGASGRSTLFVQDASGVGFATRNASNQIVRYTGASPLPAGSATTANTANYIVSSDLTRTAALNFQTLQINTSSSNVTLSLGASNLVSSGSGRTVLVTGNNNATISATTGAVTAGSFFIANYGTGTTTLGVSLSGQSFINSGPGLVDYTNVANPLDVYAAGGVTRFSGAARNFDTGVLRIYGGGVLEIGADLNDTADGAFTRAVGTAAGQVALVGNGGFSAHGEDRVVALGGVGTPSPQVWGANSFLTGNGGDNNYTFMLGSAHSTHTLEFQNAINLGTRERRIEVADGISPTNVDARLTGVISGAGGSLIKEGTGRLEISAVNTYSGATRVNAGSLLISASGKTGTDAVTVAATASIMGSGVVQGSSFTLANNATMHAGNGTLASNIGTLAFQTTAAASFEIQNGSLVMLDLGTSTNQATIDTSFGGNVVGSAGYNAYVDAFSGTGSGSHDLLTFDGAAGSTLSFSGRLSVRPGTSFSALNGQVFNLLDWGVLVGADFSGFNVGDNYRTGADDNLLQFDLPELNGGLVWDVSRFTTSGVLVVVAMVPEPSRALLLMLGTCALFMRRRRA